jgi:hypothetical protein
MGRPRKEIDRAKVTEMASRAHTTVEIALECGVSERTIRSRAKIELERGRIQRDASLRAKQFEVAMSGNPTMLIWLGKQLLGQKDRVSQEVTGLGGGPLQYERADLKQLSDAELDDLAKLVDKAYEDAQGSTPKNDGAVPPEKTDETPGDPGRD